MALMMMLLGLYYVDQPYPKVPEHGVFNMELRFGPEGAITGYFNVGIWDRLGLGLSYGGSNILGAGNPKFYEIPGIQIRLLVIEQSFVYPMVQIGFDNQGYGDYCQIGKNFGISGLEIVPSLGMNYCLEQNKGFDLYCGLDVQFGVFSALLIDYTPNFHDPLDDNKGYLNVALRMIFYGEMFFEFALRDLLGNSPNDEQLNRLVKMGFEQSF
jgi:hypothetical protein